MKKTLTVVALLAGAASVYSQGQIALSAYNAAFTIQIFNSQSMANSTTAVSYGGFSGNEEMGASANSSLNTPGSTVYAAGSALGNGYDVELLAAPGTGDAIGTLVATGPVITTWYSAAGGDPTTGLNGFYNTVTTATIAGTTTAATVALAAWNNAGGTVNTLAAAQAAGLGQWGVSATGNVASLGFGTITPPNLPTSITSFSLTASSVPEPSTIALGVMGASAFLLRLRKRQ